MHVIIGNFAYPRSLYWKIPHTVSNRLDSGDHGTNTTTSSSWGYTSKSVILSGRNEQTINQTVKNRWLLVHFSGGEWTQSVTISAIKLKFNDTEYTFNDAVTAGLIEPLVLISSSASSTSYVFSNVNNLLSGGSTNSVSYPHIFIYFKVKNTPLQSFIFNSSRDFDHTTYKYDGITIEKLEEGVEIWQERPEEN